VFRLSVQKRQGNTRMNTRTIVFWVALLNTKGERHRLGSTYDKRWGKSKEEQRIEEKNLKGGNVKNVGLRKVCERSGVGENCRAESQHHRSCTSREGQTNIKCGMGKERSQGRRGGRVTSNVEPTKLSKLGAQTDSNGKPAQPSKKSGGIGRGTTKRVVCHGESR